MTGAKTELMHNQLSHPGVPPPPGAMPHAFTSRWQRPSSLLSLWRLSEHSKSFTKNQTSFNPDSEESINSQDAVSTANPVLSGNLQRHENTQLQTNLFLQREKTST